MLKTLTAHWRQNYFHSQNEFCPKTNIFLNKENSLCISEVSPLISSPLQLSSWGYLWNHNKMVQVCLVLVPPWPECLPGCHVWPCHAGARSSQGTALGFRAAGRAEDRQFWAVQLSWVWAAAQPELHQDALCLSLFWKSCSCLDTIIPLMSENGNCSHNV